MCDSLSNIIVVNKMLSPSIIILNIATKLVPLCVTYKARSDTSDFHAASMIFVSVESFENVMYS